MGSGLKFLCMNVRGLAEKKKRTDVLQWLSKKNATIYCLTDLHVNTEKHDSFLQDWGNGGIINSSSSDSRGVCILFGKSLDYKIIDVEQDQIGNFLLATIWISPNFTVVIGVIYGLNKDDPGFYEEIKQKLLKKENHPIILCGDWNLVQNFDLDTHGYQRENNTKAKNKVLEMQSALDLEDIWRINNKNLKKYTWFSSKQPKQMARLDFFLTTPDIHSQLKKQEISHGYRTDHSLLSLEITIGNLKRGKGFWKFNTSLLHDSNYIQMVKEVIKDTLQDNNSLELGTTSLGYNQMLFEMIKLNIRGRTIAYSTKKAKENRDYEFLLEQEITKLENILTHMYIANDTNSIQEIETKILNLKLELGTKREASVKAYILRSKTQYYEEGEKATRYFCNLEKRNYINKIIHKLNIDGTIITDPSEILAKQREFYQNIYNPSVSGNENLFSKFFKRDNISKLGPEDRNFCEGAITVNEVKHVLKNMKNNKTPGTDGFPAEFYKFFWKDIGQFLINSYNESFDRGELSLTQKQGIITCLPKRQQTQRIFEI